MPFKPTVVKCFFGDLVSWTQNKLFFGQKSPYAGFQNDPLEGQNLTQNLDLKPVHQPLELKIHTK